MSRKENKAKGAEYAKMMNDKELGKDPADIRRSMNSSYMRDQLFQMNAERMKTANKYLNLSLKVGLVIHIGMAAFSALMFLYLFPKFFYKLVAANISSGSEEPHPVYDHSAWLALIPIGIVGTAVTILANKLLNKKCAVLLYLVNILYAAVGVIGAVGGFWDDMDITMGIILTVIAVIGLFMSNKTHEAIAELDYLVTQEGFPTFNEAMFYMHRSKYVRFREKWEKKNRKSADYAEFAESEKPIEAEKIIVTAAEAPGYMDGISASAEDSEEWFAKNASAEIPEAKEPPAEHEMDGLGTESGVLPENDEYYRNIAEPEIKKKLL